jgi:hypothetical protein
MSFLSFGNTLTAHKGQLPINANVVVEDILFLTTATAGKIVKFDMAFSSATSMDPMDGASGVGSSCWSKVTDYIVNTATKQFSASDVYAYVPTAVATANTRGDIIVIGKVSSVAKTGGAAHVLGQGHIPSMGTIGSVSPTAAHSSTLAITASTRKVVLIATSTDASSTTVVTGHFNGFGWGVVWTNLAYNAD